MLKTLALYPMELAYTRLAADAVPKGTRAHYLDLLHCIVQVCLRPRQAGQLKLASGASARPRSICSRMSSRCCAANAWPAMLTMYASASLC